MSNSWSQATGVFQLYSDALAGLGQHLTEPLWQLLMAELRGCRGKIVITGVDTSGIVARKMAHMLTCVERPAIYLNMTDVAHGDLGFLRDNDLVIILSRRGDPDELTRLLPGLNARNVPTLNVTENTGSAIAKASRLVVSAGVQREADLLNTLAITSILLVLAIFDVACACLMSESDYSKETLLSMHPGGDVGLMLSRGKQRQAAVSGVMNLLPLVHCYVHLMFFTSLRRYCL